MDNPNPSIQTEALPSKEQCRAIIRTVLSDSRYHHSLNVAKSARILALAYGAHEQKAYIAGLLHDVMKQTDRDKQLQIIKKSDIMLDAVSRQTPELWHAKAGAAYLSVSMGIRDPDVLNAVSYHTTARASMSVLEKILYLADFISDDRDYNGVEEMRAAAFRGLEEAMHIALAFTICDLVKRNKAIHPDTLGAYNELVLGQSETPNDR